MSANSSNVDLLHENLRRLLWEQNWESLRDIQEHAIPPVLSKTTDVLISAPTAFGKTEAAFLPILSDFSSEIPTGLGCLYISPLKALINDQFDRLGSMCERLGIIIHQWHGDVSQSHKKVVLNNGSGILLITPESLEALFVNRGHLIPSLFSNLRYVVIDELHSFIGSERGKQLQSLLRRIEISTKRIVPRIGLSATLGDLTFAARYMRTEQNFPCKIIKSNSSGQEIKLQLRGYIVNSNVAEQELVEENRVAIDNEDFREVYGDKIDIAEHLFKTLRGTNNLIFANSRSNTEQYADLLREFSERENVPNEFYPHHGSLSKELREDVEQKLKSQSLPTTAVATSTLELGIDIGAVKSIAQIGSPPSVSSLRQRLGRSGRRGEPAIMRIYIQEKELSSKLSLLDSLRCELVEAIAIVNLLIKGWYEQPTQTKLHLSTFIQQILSLLSQYGSVHAAELWKILCDRSAFGSIDKAMFAEVLKCLSKVEIIQQTSDGSIVLDLKGERIVGHYSFYASFTTSQEYQIYTHGKLLGTIPINVAIVPGLCIIFGGRRWKVLSLDIEKRIVEVERSRGGRPPNFSGSGGSTSKQIRDEMRRVYISTDVPEYLDKQAVRLLAEGRDFFHRYNLATTKLLFHNGDTLFFHWDSDIVANTILLELRAAGLEGSHEGIALHFPKTSLEMINSAFEGIKSSGFTSDIDLASTVANKLSEKYDWILNEQLIDKDYAARAIDTKSAYFAITSNS